MSGTENQSAIVQLYADTKAYFEAKGSGTAVVFGRKERWTQINQGTGGANRVVFVPGKISGDDGGLGGVDGPGEVIDPVTKTVKPRALFLQAKVLTISIWAANTDNDPSGSVDEAAQEEAIEQMLEWVVRAIKHSVAGAANAQWGSVKYNPDPNVLRFGTEYLAELEVGTQYLDDVPGFIFPTGASVSRGTLS